jgi:hypothetical protein
VRGGRREGRIEWRGAGAGVGAAEGEGLEAGAREEVGEGDGGGGDGDGGEGGVLDPSSGSGRYRKGYIEEPLMAALARIPGLPLPDRELEIVEDGRLVTVPDFAWEDVKLCRRGVVPAGCYADAPATILAWAIAMPSS